MSLRGGTCTFYGFEAFMERSENGKWYLDGGTSIGGAPALCHERHGIPPPEYLKRKLADF